ncbi:MAG: tetratricopeptide repeat protein [Phycisphaerales bacterium]
MDPASPSPDGAAHNAHFDAEAIDRFREALAEPTDNADEALAREAVSRAVAGADAGDLSRAATHFEESVNLTRDERVLFLGFQFAFRTSRLELAERFARRRIDVAANDSAVAARAWSNLGLVLHARGAWDQSEQAQHRALEIDRRIGNLEGVARDLGNLALVPESRGDLDEAERLNLESLEIAERLGASSIIATKLANLGDIAHAKGRHAEARERWTRAAALFRELGKSAWLRDYERKIASLDAENRS